MSLRDHLLDVQVFNAIKSHPEPSTLEEIAGRCVVESGPSRFRMPVELVRGVVRRLVVGGNVSDAGKRGARKLYRIDLGGKPELPDGYLYDHYGTSDRRYEVIASSYNRVNGAHLVFVFDRLETGDRVRVSVSGQREWIAALEARARSSGFDFEKRDNSFGYLHAVFDRLEALASFVRRAGA